MCSLELFSDIEVNLLGIVVGVPFFQQKRSNQLGEPSLDHVYWMIIARIAI